VNEPVNERIVIQCSGVEIEDETEVEAAEKEMDEVDRELGQSPRKNAVRRKHSSGSVGSRLTKKLNKYKMKLDFRCNGMFAYIRCSFACPSD